MRTAPVENVEYVLGEVTSLEDVEKFVRGCTSIIHLAGVAHSSLHTDADRRRSYKVNVEGTRIVSNAALENGVRRFVFVSTSHVYGLLSGLDIEESAPVDRSSYYSVTKIEAEKIVLDAADKGMEAVIARPCLIYGAGVRFNLEQMMRGIHRGYYFHITDVDPMRSFLSVENAARALVHLTRDGVAEGIYNIADSHPYSLVDFGNELADRLGRGRPRTIPHPMVHLAASFGTAIQKLGVHPPISSEILAKLSSDLTVSTSRLAQTGFEWDENVGAVLQEMANYYRDSTFDSRACAVFVN